MFRQAQKRLRKRRDRFEIIAEVLKAAKPGVHKTRIMYKAGLGTVQLTSYLTFLKSTRLLEASRINGRVVYKTTVKGLGYITGYEEIKHILRKSEHGTKP